MLEFAKKLWVDGIKAFVVPIRDIIVSKLSTDTMTEFMGKHSQNLSQYLTMRGLGYKAKAKWIGHLWSLSPRLRFFLVIYYYRQKEYMDWVTMKSVFTNFEVTRKGIEEFILTLENIRSETVRRREQAVMIPLEHIGYLDTLPFYQGTQGSLIYQIIAFNKLLNSIRLRPTPTLSVLSVEQLRDLL